MSTIAAHPVFAKGPPEPRDDLPDRADRAAGRDPRPAADDDPRLPARAEHHAVGHHPGDHRLREKPAGVRGIPVAAAGRHAVPPRAERRDDAADPHGRRPGGQPRAGAARRRRGRPGVRQLRHRRVAGRRHHHLRDHLHHSVHRDHQGRHAHLAKSPPGSRWTRCPASRWRSTPTSTPATSPRPPPASAARTSRRRPTSTGPWTAPPSSSAATRSPASSSRSSTSSAACTSAWSSTGGTCGAA